MVKMRDPERIYDVMGEIQSVWEDRPDMRLGQLLCNALNIGSKRLFYMEDETLMQEVLAFCKKQPVSSSGIEITPISSSDW